MWIGRVLFVSTKSEANVVDFIRTKLAGGVWVTPTAELTDKKCCISTKWGLKPKKDVCKRFGNLHLRMKKRKSNNKDKSGSETFCSLIRFSTDA